jgi:6-pyruvoyltetrahydropterin/6-carboxytetrahydropterin synthase
MLMPHTITRYHDFCAGHRVAGHENKCAHFHGHNYRIHFTCAAKKLDDLGRIIDFSVVKERLCNWLEVKWDHKFLLWEKDPWNHAYIDAHHFLGSSSSGFITVPFNPTAENMAQYLVDVVGPLVLEDTEVELIKVKVEETRKCSATYRKEN